MKIKFFAIFFLLFAFSVIMKAQTSTYPCKDTIIYKSVDIFPFFKGGYNQLLKFIADNLNPEIDSTFSTTKTKVVIQVVINCEGKVCTPKVIQSAGSVLDDEALRVVSLLPDFATGLLNGKAVNVLFNIPIQYEFKKN